MNSLSFVNAIKSAVNDPTTRNLLLLMLTLGASACIGIWVDSQRILKDIRRNDGDGKSDDQFAKSLDSAERLGPRAERAARLFGPVVSQLAERLPVSIAGREPGWLVKGDIPIAYTEACSEQLGRRNDFFLLLYSIGESLTAIALVFTFSFIAIVLVAEVPPAIQAAMASGEQGEASTHLRNAVFLIGAKFAVSALGLFLSLLFRLVEGKCRTTVIDEARFSAHQHRRLFISRDAYQFPRLISLLDATKLEVAQLRGDGQRHSSVLINALHSLASIDVSVKGLGEEVTAHLNKLMKEEVAKQICDALDDLRSKSEEMMERLAGNLSTITLQGQEQLRDGLGVLNDALEQVRATIANQAKSDIQAVVEEIRGALSGGFSNESQSMMRAMEALRDVLPKLETQMRRMTEDVSAEMSTRAAANAAAQEKLLAEVAHAMDANREAQAESRDALSRLLESASTSAQDLHSSIAKSGEELVTRMTSSSGESIQKLQSQLTGLGEWIGADATGFRTEVETARAALSEARLALVADVEAARSLARELRSATGSANESLAHANTALSSFSRAGASVERASTQIGQASQSLEGWLAGEASLLSQQKQLAETILPKLMSSFVDMLEEQSRKLQDGWRELSKQVEHTVNKTGTEFASSVEELSVTVESLKTAVQQSAVPRR